MSTKQQDEELKTFLGTLKVHNKELDTCFNDAVAIHHLERLVTRRLSQTRTDTIRECRQKHEAELARITADLARCLGMLRALQHPEERLEAKYDLGRIKHLASGEGEDVNP